MFPVLWLCKLCYLSGKLMRDSALNRLNNLQEFVTAFELFCCSKAAGNYILVFH